MPRVNITIETDSIEGGWRMLRGLEALMQLGSPGVLVIALASEPLTIDPAGFLGEKPADPPPPAEPAAAAEKPKRQPRTTKPAETTAAPPAEEKPAEPPVGTAAADAPAPRDDGQEEQVKLSVDFLRQRVTFLSGIVGVPDAMKVVKLSGHDKIASIPEEKWASFHQLLESKIAEAEAAKAAA